MCDGSEEPTGDDTDLLSAHPESVRVLNKSDLGRSSGWSESDYGIGSVAVSARTGEGLETLRSKIHSSLLSGQNLGTEMVTNERHVRDLRTAQAALEQATEAVRSGAPGEVISFEIDEGLAALSSILGETTAQDILDKIFSQFCIGK